MPKGSGKDFKIISKGFAKEFNWLPQDFWGFDQYLNSCLKEFIRICQGIQLISKRILKDLVRCLIDSPMV